MDSTRQRQALEEMIRETFDWSSEKSVHMLHVYRDLLLEDSDPRAEAFNPEGPPPWTRVVNPSGHGHTGFSRQCLEAKTLAQDLFGGDPPYGVGEFWGETRWLDLRVYHQRELVPILERLCAAAPRFPLLSELFIIYIPNYPPQGPEDAVPLATDVFNLMQEGGPLSQVRALWLGGFDVVPSALANMRLPLKRLLWAGSLSRRDLVALSTGAPDLEVLSLSESWSSPVGIVDFIKVASQFTKLKALQVNAGRTPNEIIKALKTLGKSSIRELHLTDLSGSKWPRVLLDLPELKDVVVWVYPRNDVPGCPLPVLQERNAAVVERLRARGEEIPFFK